MPAEQLGLVFPSRDRLEQRFALFHQANPHVYQQLEERALRLYADGARRISVKALWEQLRQEAARRAEPNLYAFDNSLTALYARELLERHPLLATVIETRTRKSA